MPNFILDFLNSQFQDNPGSLFAYAFLIFVAFHFLKWSGKKLYISYLNLKAKAENSEKLFQEEKEQQAKKETRAQIKESNIAIKQVEKHLEKLNGSVAEHHGNKVKHFDEMKCNKMHIALINEMDRKFDETAQKLFKRMDTLTETIFEIKGATAEK